MRALVLVLRLRRRSILALVGSMVVFGALQAGGFATIAGDTVAERIQFARESQALARQVNFLLPLPTDLSTIGGYITWRIFGGLPFLLGLWAIWFAVATTRGDESDGLTEQFLAAGLTRASIVSRATAGFTVASMAMIAALCLSLGATAGAAGSLPAGDLALQGLALLCVLLSLFGIGFVAAQLVSNVRTAFGIGAVVAFLFNLVNSMGDSVPALKTVRFLSPLSWYSANEPLVAGGSFSPMACAGLAALAAVLIFVAALMFNRRDLGEALLRRRAGGELVTSPEGLRWFRLPVIGSLYEQRNALALWIAGTCALAAYFTTTAPSLVESLQGVTSLQSYLRAVSEGNIQRSIIGLFLLGTMQLVLALLAITFVARWAREDKQGRLELELSTPVSRLGVVVRRIISLIAAVTTILVISMAFLSVMAAQQSIEIGLGPAVRTVALLLVFTLSFAAVGTLLTAVVPRIAVFALTGFAVVGYFIKEVAPILGWPSWVLNLSVFDVIGNPLVAPPDTAKVVGLMSATVTALVGGAVMMRTRDVGS